MYLCRDFCCVQQQNKRLLFFNPSFWYAFMAAIIVPEVVACTSCSKDSFHKNKLFRIYSNQYNGLLYYIEQLSC